MKKIFSLLLIVTMISSLCACEFTENLTQKEILQSDQIVTIDNFCEYEIKNAIILEDISDTGLSVKTKEGTKNLCLLMNIKNLCSEQIDVSECITMELTFNNKQKYDDVEYYVVGEDLSISLDIKKGFKSDPSLTPLKNDRVYCVIEIPDDVANQPEKLKLNIKLKNKSYVYGSEILCAYQYIEKVCELADRYYEEFDKFMNLLNYDVPFLFDKNKAAEKVVTTTSAIKTELSAIISELAALTPPPCYEDGYNALKQHLNIYYDVIVTLSDSNTAQDPNVYKDLGEKLENGEYVDSLETAITNMPFLKDTKLENIT